MKCVAVVALLGACAEPDHWSFTSRPIEGQGTTVVLIWITDSPVDGADALFVSFESVGLGGAVLPCEGRAIDLLSLRNGRQALLARGEVPAGTYDSLILRLSPRGPHRVRVRGEECPIELLEDVVEIEGPFAVREGTELLVDFDARMSVLEVGGRWMLRPRCVAADLSEARFVEGLVLDEGGRPVAGAVVSAQLGGEEISSGRTDGDGRFRLGPAPAGPVTLVATAPGHGIATGTGVLALPGADTGELSGVAAGSYVRLVKGGLLIAVAGVDPETGGYSFPQVPSGVYELEVWGAGGLLERIPVAR